MSVLWFLLSTPLLRITKLVIVLRVTYFIFSAIVLFYLMKRQSVLREGRDELRLVVDRLREAVLIHRDEIIVYANPCALEFFGARREEEIVGKHILSITCPEYRDIALQRINLLAQGVPSKVMEQKFQTLSGDVRDVEVVGVPITFQGKSAIQVLIRDITERKLTEEALRRSDKLVAVGELAAGIAHEIRNPLTSLKGFVQLMLPEGTESQQRYLAIMNSEISRMEMIINELLVLGKPKAHSREVTDVAAILEDVIALLEPRALLDNIVISKLEEATNLLVDCDRNQIKQVFLNIAKNAIEAMPHGGNLEVEFKNIGTTLQMTFRDEGSGIPLERIPNIGTPFYTTKERGTGLGLLVSSRIIDTHHGKLTISSELGQGTTVTVILPSVLG